MLICVWLTGCKKESSMSATNGTAAINDLQVGNNKQCRLTKLVNGPYSTWNFYYNEQGLADKWKIVIVNGPVENWKLTYDTSGKITYGRAYDDYGNLIYTTSFTYDDKLVKKQVWNDVINNYSFDIFFTHNHKGQITREDYSDGTHIIMNYDDMNNNTRNDYYISSFLYFSDIYEFNVPVRDPLLSVSGIDFLFPYSGAGYHSNLWFSRNLSIAYDYDGTQYVYNDFSASKKDITVGSRNMPIAINYFDTVSQSIFNYTFDYSCSGNARENTIPQSSSTIGKNKSVISPGPLFLGKGKSLKDQLLEMRMHIKDLKNLNNNQ